MSIKYVENQADFENIIDQNQYVLVEFLPPGVRIARLLNLY